MSIEVILGSDVWTWSSALGVCEREDIVPQLEAEVADNVWGILSSHLHWDHSLPMRGLQFQSITSQNRVSNSQIFGSPQLEFYNWCQRSCNSSLRIDTRLGFAYSKEQVSYWKLHIFVLFRWWKQRVELSNQLDRHDDIRFRRCWSSPKSIWLVVRSNDFTNERSINDVFSTS